MPSIAICDFAEVFKTNDTAKLETADVLLVAGGDDRGEPVRVHNVADKHEAIMEAVEKYGRTGRSGDRDKRPYNFVAIRFTNRNVLDAGYAYYMFQHMNQNQRYWQRLYDGKPGIRMAQAIAIKDVERLSFQLR